MIIDVVIVNYNSTKYSLRAIESFKSKTFRHDLNIIVVDNASNDNTKEDIDSYRTKIPNLVYFRWDENNGADRNFIKVVELASGEYCWLMGSDDLIEDGSINYVLNFLEKNIY